jgi:hypothetical protein
MQEVAGSIPAGSTRFQAKLQKIACDSGPVERPIANESFISVPIV